MLKLSDQEFYKTMINMLRVLMDNKGQYERADEDNVNRDMNILRKNQKEMLKIKNTVNKTKKGFNGFISRLNMAKGKICEFEAISTETFKTEKQGEHRMKNQNSVSKNCRTT